MTPGSRYHVGPRDVFAARFFLLLRVLRVGMHAPLGKLLCDTAIRNSTRLRECAALGAPVQVVDSRCAAASDFRSLADVVVEHVSGARSASDPAWAEVP